MAAGAEFSLPCESNSSMDIYPKNTASHFKVNIREPLELDDEWQVALSEIQFPCAWDNVREGSNRLLIRWRFKNSKEGKPYMIWKRVPAGYYANTASLVAKINELASHYGVGRLKGIALTYDDVTRRVTIKTKDVTFTRGTDGKEFPVNASIKLKGDIARLLGFPSDRLITSNKTVASPFAASPSGGFHQMYVYSDLIPPQPHPDGNVPVLRVIAVEHDRQEKRYTSVHFQQPYFMSLAKSRINSIEFKIADSTGRAVGFSHGNAVIVLLFRRKPT